MIDYYHNTANTNLPPALTLRRNKTGLFFLNHKNKS